MCDFDIYFDSDHVVNNYWDSTMLHLLVFFVWLMWHISHRQLAAHPPTTKKRKTSCCKADAAWLRSRKIWTFDCSLGPEDSALCTCDQLQ